MRGLFWLTVLGARVYHSGEGNSSVEECHMAAHGTNQGRNSEGSRATVNFKVHVSVIPFFQCGPTPQAFITSNSTSSRDHLFKHTSLGNTQVDLYGLTANWLT